jgi:hypothetical protein
MEIKNLNAEPFDGSIFPSIGFNVEIEYVKYQESITYINGWLKTDDGKIISSLEQIASQDKSSELAGKDSNKDAYFLKEIYRTKLIALLGKNSLDHIEKRRMAQRKNDVVLTLELNVCSFKSRISIAESYSLNSKDMGFPDIKGLDPSALYQKF